MCNCRSRIENALTERHAQNTPNETEHKAVLQGYGIKITGDMQMRESVYMPVEMISTVTTKKTGTARRRTRKMQMHFTYCPFCAEKLAT